MTIRLVIPTERGLGAIISDEVSGLNSKEESQRSILSGLIAYYTQMKSLELAPHDISKEANKSTYRIYAQAGKYHGLVNMIYKGQQSVSDYSTKPPYVFPAEVFALFFNYGFKTMSAEQRERVAKEERDGFVEFFKRRRF